MTEMMQDESSPVTSSTASGVPDQRPATQVDTPPVRGSTFRFRGSTFRFRGLALAIIGQLFPEAHFEIHRVGYPEETDFSPVGTELVEKLTDIDTESIFRVTMTQCDTPREAEGPLFWSKMNTYPGCLTAEEYGNILKLGRDGLGKIMLLTFCDDRNHSWDLVRQIPGREYTLEDCFDALMVPPEFRNDIHEFGPKLWTVGEEIPYVYICKDMPLRLVITKINNLMRA